METFLQITKEHMPAVASLIALCFMLHEARRLSSDIISNIRDVSPDGWKKLAAIQKALVNFYILVGLTVVVIARYMTELDEKLYIALLIAGLTSFGIKLGSDNRSKE